LVRDKARLQGNDAQANAGENEHIVTLPDGDYPPVMLHWRERAARGNQSPSLGPGNQVLWMGLALGGGIGQRKDDGPLGMLGHVTHDGFGEGAWLGRGAYQNRGMHMGHHLLERDLSRLGQRPLRDPFLWLSKELLFHFQIAPSRLHETLTIEQPKR